MTCPLKAHSRSNPCFARPPNIHRRAHKWRYELKLDGFRAIGRKAGRVAQLWSRNHKNFARQFPGVVKALAGLPRDIVIDGEIVALDEQGRPSFNLLQGFGSAGEIVLYAFDLLMLDGKDVRLWPLDDRREQLREILVALPDTIRYSESFDVALPELVRAVRKHQLEGIVAKRAGSQYRSGERSGDWLKWRANRCQEFVIGGYMPKDNILDSLLVGYCDGCRPDVCGQRPCRHTAGVPAGSAIASRAAANPAMPVSQSTGWR